MEKKKIIILVTIIVVVLVLLGIVLYKYDKAPKEIESKLESTSTQSKEELKIESTDYSALIPVSGNIKTHYTGVATNTKSDQVNYDLIDLYIMDNNEIVVTQSYGNNVVAYFGSYAGNFDGDNVKMIYKPILKGASCQLTSYEHDIIDIYKNTDESVFFEELDANKEVIKLVDAGTTSKDLLNSIHCYKDPSDVK